MIDGSRWQRADATRVVGYSGLVLLLTLLSVALGRTLTGTLDAIGWPYELDYGEGIVWQQMDGILAGNGYAPLLTFPAIVFHYPPVYHWTVGAVIALLPGIDPLAAGRATSAVAAALAAILVGGLVYAAVPAGARDWPRWIGAITAGGAFLVGQTVAPWIALMRVDFVAVALTLGGLAATARALQSGRTGSPAIYLAALSFALAVYTKQTAILAPAAAVVALWIARPEDAWRLAVSAIGLGLGALATLQTATGGSFLTHVLSANINRFAPGNWTLIALVLASQLPLLLLAGAVGARMVTAWRSGDGLTIIRTSPVEAVRLLLIVYAFLRVATLPMALKSGAWTNYMIDLFSVAAVLAGCSVAALAAALQRGERISPAIAILVFGGLPFQFAQAEAPHLVTRDPAFARTSAELTAQIRAADGPVLTDYMVLVRRAGRPVSVEPAIVAELAHAGRYDEAGLIRLIRACRFAFVLTQGDDQIYHDRYNPAVRAAISARYPRMIQHDGAVLRLPVGCRPVTADRAPSPRP